MAEESRPSDVFSPPRTGSIQGSSMEASTVPTASGAAAPGTVHDVGMLLFELRRDPRPGSRMTPEVAEMVVNRCVIAALEVLTAANAAVAVSGTEARPVVEARFEGEHSPLR